MKKSVFKRKKGITLVEVSITIALVSILMAEVLTFTALIRSQLVLNSTQNAGIREAMMTAELIKSDFRDCDTPSSEIKIGEDEDGTGGLEFADWGEYWREKARTEFNCGRILNVEFTSIRYAYYPEGTIIDGNLDSGDPVICTITYLIYTKDEHSAKCGEYKFVMMRRTIIAPEEATPATPEPTP